MTDERRRVVRRRLLLAGLVPLLLAMLFAAKVGTMLALDDRGRSAFGDDRFDSAQSAFAINARVNLLEPWVSPFDEGTAEYRLADYTTAQALLERALVTVPSEQECLVRINLGLTLEALGDASLADGARDQAEQRWQEGIGVLDAGGCRGAASADAAASASAAAAAAALTAASAQSLAERLAEKLAERVSDPDVEETTPPDEPDDPLTEAEELEQRNEEAQEQRRKNEETREDEPPDPDTPPTYSW